MSGKKDFTDLKDFKKNDKNNLINDKIVNIKKEEDNEKVIEIELSSGEIIKEKLSVFK